VIRIKYNLLQQQVSPYFYRKMKKFLFLITLLAMWTSTAPAIGENATTSHNYEAGVLINGIRWATRNVDTPGTFAQNPEDIGLFYQWFSYTSLNVIGTVSGSGNAVSADSPCPEGWRIPTQAELCLLRDARSVWTIRNGVNGRLFGTAPNQIFLPAAGFFRDNDGKMDSKNSLGLYWSSTRNKNRNAVGLSFNRHGVNVLSFWRQSSAFSIRCVAEQ
jgi:uncharacterized protein (TIGR02145 family)